MRWDRDGCVASAANRSRATRDATIPPLRSYGTDALPTPAEAMQQPFGAFPSWFIECDRCGKITILNEAHANQRQRGIVLHVLLARMRHDGCQGRRSCLSASMASPACRCGASCCWAERNRSDACSVWWTT